jgi:eukaryotic-like serine/threonine-protein kinase
MASEDDDPLEVEVQSALAEYLVRCDSGQAPDREQFLAQHPRLADKLADLLSAADWIEQLAGPTAAGLGAGEEPATSSNAGPAEVGSPAAMRTAAPAAGGLEDTHPLLVPAVATSAVDPNSATLPATPHSLPPDISAAAARVDPELSQPALPCRFGDYMLERVLGRGGMGVVYAGHQVNLQRTVAIKMIRSGALASPEEVQRFYAEARSAAKLDHPHIVTVYQCGEQDGHHYFSMDYVRGLDLAKMIQDGAMECRRAARYVRDVARAIQYAHDQGVLHRDLKPANVLVDENDQVHITDFGLAKLVGHETGLTATGAALGTPSYMPPEQAAGRTDEHDYRTDVYSLGAVLFALVTGKPPFQGNSVVQTLMQVLHRSAPLARQVHPGVDQDMETIIAKCLHKTPENRYATAAALADDLDRYLQGAPILARPVSRLRRAVHWSLGIPIVGALFGRRIEEPLASHRWAQRGLVATFCALLFALLIYWPADTPGPQKVPNRIRFAAGRAGGSYDLVGRAICDRLSELSKHPVDIEATEGAIDNRERLLDGRANLALLQASTLNSSRLAVVAPLYYEAIHVLVRNASSLTAIQDFRGRRILLGPERSGSRAVAKRILLHHQVELAAIESDPSDWLNLNEHPEIEAAIVVVQVGNPGMHALLASGRYRLLPIDDAVKFSLDEPTFHPLPITAEDYPGAIPEGEPLTTVATTAFLVGRSDTSPDLVRQALAAIYEPEMIRNYRLLPPEKAANWQGIPWHSIADEYFEQYRTAQ